MGELDQMKALLDAKASNKTTERLLEELNTKNTHLEQARQQAHEKDQQLA